MNNKGFTLIEIIIVIVILGILATLAVPKITGQMESSRAAEAMQMFGSVRRAATDCLSMSNGAAASCLTGAQLGVGMPAGAAFSYSTVDVGNVINVKATRTINTVANAMCMTITGDGLGSVTNVAYGVFPANSTFAGIINRSNTGAGNAVLATCTDGTNYANMLN